MESRELFLAVEVEAVKEDIILNLEEKEQTVK